MPTKAFTKKTTTKKEMTKKLGKSAKKNAVPAFFPKYPEYRMADLVTCDQYRDLNVSRAKRLQGYVRENETLGEYTFRLFPNSIASQYLRKTKRLTDIDVLSNIVDEFVTNHSMNIPADDVMVMHLRVGDVIRAVLMVGGGWLVAWYRVRGVGISRKKKLFRRDVQYY